MLLRTLGGLALEGSSFRRPKPLLLLAYLAIEGPADRGRLASLFWPNHDRPRQNLAVAVSQIRAVAPDALSSEDGRLVAQVGCDARELVSAVTAGDWRHAEKSYRGSFLESYPVGVGEELEGWVLETRDYLGGMLGSSLIDGALEHIEIGEPRQALDLAERAFRLYEGGIDLEAERLEGLHSVLSQLGSPHAADLRRTAAELGVELGGSAASRTSARPTQTTATQLPPKPVSPLVGRERELDELYGLLEGPSRLITITGLSGVGKSRLALELCHKAAERAFERVVFVRMEPVSDPKSALGHVASSVGFSLSPGAAALPELALFLDESRTLLVLDNMEHLVGWGSELEELVARTQRLVVLTTSTQPLALRDETLLFLDGLELTPSPEDPETSRCAAVRFFEERARRSVSRFAAESDLNAVWRICGLVGGSPLGMEMAAGLVRVLSLGELAERLEERPEEIVAVTVSVPERHRSLSRICEHTWAFLEDSERAVLAALSVFKESFSVEDIEAVCGPALADLARLERRSLVKRDGERYALHPLIKRYAADRLADDPGAEVAARDRHAEHVARAMWQYATRTDVRTEGEAVRAAERALPDAIAAWHWSVERGAGENICNLMPMLLSVLNGRGRIATWNELIDAAVDRLDHLPAAASHLHIMLASRAAIQGDRQMARSHVKAAAAAAVVSNDTTSEFLAKLRLAVMDDPENWHSTRSLFRALLRQSRDAGDWSLVATSYVNLSKSEASAHRHGQLLALGLRYLRRHKYLSTDTPLVYFLAAHLTDSCGNHRAALDVTLEHLLAVEEALAQPYLLVDLHSMAAYYSLNVGDLEGGYRHHEIATRLANRRAEAPDFVYWTPEYHWMPWAASFVALHTEGPEASLRAGLDRVHTVEARDLAVHVKLACGDREGAVAMAEGWHERLRTHEVMRDDFHVQATRERLRATVASDSAQKRRHLAAALRSCAEHHFVPLALDCMVSCRHLFPDLVSEEEAVEAATHPAAYHSTPLFLTGFRGSPPAKAASAPYSVDEVLRRSAALARRLEA